MRRAIFWEKHAGNSWAETGIRESGWCVELPTLPRVKCQKKGWMNNIILYSLGISAFPLIFHQNVLNATVESFFGNYTGLFIMLIRKCSMMARVAKYIYIIYSKASVFTANQGTTFAFLTCRDPHTVMFFLLALWGPLTGIIIMIIAAN